MVRLFSCIMHVTDWATCKLLVEDEIGKTEARGPLGVRKAVELHACRQLGADRNRKASQPLFLAPLCSYCNACLDHWRGRLCQIEGNLRMQAKPNVHAKT